MAGGSPGSDAMSDLFAFDNTINLGQLIVGATTVAGGVWALIKMLTDVRMVKESQAHIGTRLDGFDTELKKQTEILITLAETRAGVTALKEELQRVREDVVRVRDEMSRDRAPRSLVTT